jgi:hypothetical protein
MSTLGLAHTLAALGEWYNGRFYEKISEWTKTRSALSAKNMQAIFLLGDAFPLRSRHFHVHCQSGESEDEARNNNNKTSLPLKLEFQERGTLGGM